MLLSQPADAGGRGLPRRLLGRAQRGADLVVGQVVAVAEHDGGALLRRQLVGQRREILERRQAVLDRELDEYFAGKRQHSDVATDTRFLPEYNRVVLEKLARVEYGTTTTYGTLAAQTGNPRAARAVGTVMHRNPIPIILPCHRVIGASGSLTGYAGGLDLKERLLRLEGAIL